ncbi:MAG: hypothetical protein Q7S83_02940 [bacterium]|nr:hypothetical protein [bacterium]
MNTSLTRLSCALILFAVAGCAAVPVAPPVALESRHGFTVRGDVTQEVVDKLDRILDDMEPDPVSAIHSVEVTKDHSKCEDCSAYCTPSGHILFLDYSVNAADTVFHEVAHAHHFARGCRSHVCSCGFCSEWRRIAGDVYGKGKDYRYGKPDDYPGYGMVSYYSSKSYWEDVAEMTSDAYCYKTGRDSALRRLKAAGELDEDPRYGKKLKLLAKYGFISQKLCDEILKP